MSAAPPVSPVGSNSNGSRVVGVASAAAPLSPFPSWVLGCVSSMSAATCTHPIDVVKVRLQLQGEGVGGKGVGLFGTGMGIIRSEGISGLYRGLTASYARQITYSGTRIGSYPIIKSMLQGDNPKATKLQMVLSGIIAGGVGSAIGNPTDVVLVRMQADQRRPPELRRNYRNIVDGLSRMVREEGPMSLTKGIGPTVARGVMTTIGQLAVYNVVKDSIEEAGLLSDGIILHFCSSVIAGLAACVLNNPVDVVKTRIMNADAGKYTGIVDCVVKTFKAEGPLGFYKGFLPNWARLGPQTVITMMVLEQVTQLYRKLAFGT